MQNKGLLKYKLHHVIFWMLVFGFWYFLRYEDYKVPGRAFTVTLIKVIDLALLIYITNYVLLPRLFYKKKYTGFILAFVLLVVTSSVIKMNILGRLMHTPQLYSLSGDLKTRIYDNVLPHFLFNSLNSVYFLIDKNNAEARRSLHKFSDMLRYQLYEVNGARIPVEKEIGYLKDYVDLQTLRKDDRYSVTFTYSP